MQGPPISGTVSGSANLDLFALIIRRENNINLIIPGLTRNPVQANNEWRALRATT